MLFANRVEAGHRLAQALAGFRGQNVVVLGVPRGGVVVAAEVARFLNAPLDVSVPRKVPAPGNPELAIGAVASDGTVVADPLAQSYLSITPEYMNRAVEEQVAEIHRRLQAYRGDKPPLEVSGKTVIVVDDGIATGNTVRACLLSLRKQSPALLVLAVPVAPPASVRRLEEDADRVVVLETPEPFYAVGEWYQDFSQVSDQEVIALLRQP